MLVDDPQRIQSTYKDELIVGRRPYLWRLNDSSEIDRALVLGFDSKDHFGIIVVFDNKRPARGLVATRARDF